MLEILKYLIENDLIGEVLEQVLDELKQDVLNTDLAEQGFSRHQIGNAMKWMNMLASKLETPKVENFSEIPINKQSVRIYTEDEREKLGNHGLRFLLQLELKGVVSPNVRELILHHVMSLKIERLNIEQFKWITLMVMYQHSGYSSPSQWLADLSQRMNKNLH